MYAKQLSSLFSFDVNIQLNQSNINETKSKLQLIWSKLLCGKERKNTRRLTFF